MATKACSGCSALEQKCADLKYCNASLLTQLLAQIKASELNRAIITDLQTKLDEQELQMYKLNIASDIARVENATLKKNLRTVKETHPWYGSETLPRRSDRLGDRKRARRD